MLIDVKVRTRKQISNITELDDGSYVAELKSAPTKNMANKELRDLVADLFKVRKNQVRIKSGRYGTYKILEIDEQREMSIPN